MDELLFSINIVFPIFIIIGFGYLITRLKFIDQSFIKGINTLVFNFAIPAFLFTELARADMKESFDAKFILFCMAATISSFLLSWLIAEVLVKDKTKVGTFVQGCYRTNYAFLAIPLIILIVGSSGTPKAALITTFIIPFNNIAAVFILSIRSNQLDVQVDYKKMIIDIFKNPFIIAILIGIPFSLLYTFTNFSILDYQNTKMIATSFDYIARLGTPLALISIGAMIDFSSIKKSIKMAMGASIIKVIIMPLLITFIAYYLHFTGLDLLIIFIAFGTPTAVSSYILASKMKGDHVLASNIVMISTFLSIFTITIGIYIFKILEIL